MYLIAGLGNPGKKYENSRHNVGFRVIYALGETQKIKSTTKKFKAIYAKGSFACEKVILAQPQTYMNHSGEAISLLMNYFKIPVSKLIVIYDDLDLPLGKIRIRSKGSSGGHKGLKSIIQHLGTKDFLRIRIGIDRPPVDWQVENYVLASFNEKEEEIIEKSVEKTIKAIATIINEGLVLAMNKYN